MQQPCFMGLVWQGKWIDLTCLSLRETIICLVKTQYIEILNWTYIGLATEMSVILQSRTWNAAPIPYNILATEGPLGEICKIKHMKFPEICKDSFIWYTPI